jgi:hypothetical protein
MKKNILVTKVLYKIMFFLMNFESILWTIAEVLIYPIAFARRRIALIISKRIKEK